MSTPTLQKSPDPERQRRSRSGCYTCRSRKKKCGEDFDSEGICSRCAIAGFHCERNTPIRRRKPAAAPTQPASKASPSWPPTASTSAPLSPSSLIPLVPRPLLPTPASLNPLASTSNLSFTPSSHIHGPFLPPPAALNSLPSSAFTPSYHPSDDSPRDLLSPVDYGHFSDHVYGLLEQFAPMPGSELAHGDVLLDWNSIMQGEEAGTKVEGREEALELRRREHEVLKLQGSRELPSDMAAVYSSLNSDFLASLPKAAREAIARRWGDLASSTELGRAASMALVMLRLLRTSDSEDVEEQERLLAESNSYFELAVTHLSDLSSDSTSTLLEMQLNAVMDLHHHQLDLSGATSAYAVLFVGEVFINQALGPRPQIDFRTLTGIDTEIFRVFIYTDVFRTVCLGGRRTLFTFVDLPGDALPTPSPPPPPAPTSTSYMGLRSDLLLCLAAASNLAMDAPGLSSETVREKGDAIEKAIRDWRPLVPDAEGLSDSWAFVRDMATQEMWRHAALIHYFQAVHHHGPFSLPLRDSLHQILDLGSHTSSSHQRPSHNLDGYARACPWFLAATCAILPTDRDICRQGLEECGPAKVFRDNLRAVEMVWEGMDREGMSPNWKEVLVKEGGFVAFL